MPDQHIHCSVNNCHYWSEGNVCQAEEIMVTSDAFGDYDTDRVDAKRAAGISPTPADSSMATCCKTFIEKGKNARNDGIRKMS